MDIALPLREIGLCLRQVHANHANAAIEKQPAELVAEAGRRAGHDHRLRQGERK